MHITVASMLPVLLAFGANPIPAVATSFGPLKPCRQFGNVRNNSSLCRHNEFEEFSRRSADKACHTDRVLPYPSGKQLLSRGTFFLPLHEASISIAPESSASL